MNFKEDVTSFRVHRNTQVSESMNHSKTPIVGEETVIRERGSGETADIAHV